MYRPDIEATDVLEQLDDDQVGMSLWARCYAQERAEPERLRPFGSSSGNISRLPAERLARGSRCSC